VKQLTREEIYANSLLRMIVVIIIYHIHLSTQSMKSTIYIC